MPIAHITSIFDSGCEVKMITAFGLSLITFKRYLVFQRPDKYDLGKRTCSIVELT